MTDKPFNALTATPAQLAARIKEIDAADRSSRLRIRDEQDLRNLGALSEHDIAKARAWSLMSAEDRAKLTQIDDAAKAEAQRQFKIEHEKFLDQQRRKYGMEL